MHIPGKSPGGEETPPLPGSEFTAAIRTCGRFQQVAIIKRVVEFTEKGGFRNLPVIGVCVIHDLRTGNQIDLILILPDILLVVNQCTGCYLTLAHSLRRSHRILPDVDWLAISV